MTRIHPAAWGAALLLHGAVAAVLMQPSASPMPGSPGGLVVGLAFAAGTAGVPPATDPSEDRGADVADLPERPSAEPYAVEPAPSPTPAALVPSPSAPPAPAPQEPPAALPPPPTPAPPAAAHRVTRARPPAAPASSGDATAALPPDYVAALRRILERNLRFPMVAREQGLSGTVTVRFSVTRDGRVLTAALARSSGEPSLDREALALLERVSPLPPLPSGFPEPVARLVVPVVLTMR